MNEHPGDTARRRSRWAWLFGSLLVAVIGIAVAVALTRNPTPHARLAPPSTTLPSLSAVVGTAPATPPSAPGLRSPVAAAELSAARQAARAFLSGYLPYLYGHSPIRRLSDLTAALGAELSRHPPRITPAQRTRHPRLLALTAVGRSPHTVLATATVADGSTPPYPIRLILARQAGRWLVTAIPS